MSTSQQHETRIEHDSLGPVEVPANAFWGAQTQRSLENFAIGIETFPAAFIHALGQVKRTAAEVNLQFKLLEPARAQAIISAAAEVAAGKLDAHFPLSIWQTGSGTQTNMNANEVIAYRAMQLLDAHESGQPRIHPNDEVNRSQSSNDTIPTAMHLAVVSAVHDNLLPNLRALQQSLALHAATWQSIVKIGRTHLQDATPLTLGQEFSAYAAQLDDAIARIARELTGLYALAQGGTAVGTGLNAPADFGRAFAQRLAATTGLPFEASANAFAGIAAHDALVGMSGALNTAAAGLFKIAQDIRLLASGPRCGLGELPLPANEPGSSIMPGKINPTQCEALTMICTQVMGNHATVSFAGSQGNFELNAFKPVIVYNVLQSVRLLSDGCDSFRRLCVDGIEPDEARIAELLQQSLMLVTALVPHIGYDKAAKIALAAQREGTSLREQAIASGWVSEADFDRWVDPATMVTPR